MKLSPRDDAFLRCALCHGALSAPSWTCPRCGTRAHEECRAWVVRCPTIGCRIRIEPLPRRRRGLAWIVAAGAAAAVVFATGVSLYHVDRAPTKLIDLDPGLRGSPQKTRQEAPRTRCDAREPELSSGSGDREAPRTDRSNPAKPRPKPVPCSHWTARDIENTTQAHHEARLALEQRNAGDYAGAIETVTRLIEKRPGWAELYAIRSTFRRECCAPGATADADEAIRLAPGIAAWHYARSQAEECEGSAKRALADLDAMVALGANECGCVLEGRGRLLQLVGDHAGAVAALERARELRADDPGVALWLALLTEDPSPVAPFTKGEGQKVAVARHLAGSMRGTLNFEVGVGESGRARRERYCEACCYTGLLAELRGDVEGARKSYQECLAMEAGNLIEYGWARARLAASLSPLSLVDGENARTIAEASAAIPWEPHEASNYARRAEARLRCGLPGSLADIDHALELRPGVPEWHRLRASAQELEGTPEAAVAGWDEAIRLASEPASLGHVFRAVDRWLAGQKEGAAADLAEARKLHERGYVAVWSHLLLHDASDLESVHSCRDWERSVVDLVRGKSTVEDTLAVARRGATEYERREHLCEAYGFAGILAEQRGDLGTARASYRACLATGSGWCLEYTWSKARLAQMGR